MIEWTPIYIASQVLTIIMYVCLCITYFIHDRKYILVLNILAHIIQGVSFALLGGFTGVAMNIFNAVRDIFLVIDEKKHKKTDKITKKDICILIIFILAIILLTLFTYSGVLSLLSVIGTIIFTYAVWQKNTKVYRFLGIPVSIAWLGYHISLESIFAVILEGALLISTILGYVFEVIRTKKKR